MDFSAEDIMERINSTREGSVWASLDIKLVSVARDHLVAIMPIGPNHRQQLGFLHGGISITLAESLASLGSVLNIDGDNQMAFGLEINASHLRSKREGVLTGTATPLRLGRTTHVWDVRITDEQERLICVCRCTIAIVNRSPENGNVFKILG
ncbi:MAG TPA: PaaI family thioesterase [Ktedonobacteraceae bacterium]|nr:PaaI family thioesterase [Ktedonobacteraceae bacterium]